MSAVPEPLAPSAPLWRRGIPWLGAACLFALLIVSRRPDAILNPQLYAEDGARWFGQAYYRGLPALWLPAGGYYQTFSRSVAAAAQLVPLEHVPIFYNLLALMAEMAAPLFLLSDRFREILPSSRSRFLVALAWIAVPSSYETRLNVTNSMTHLAMLAFLVLVASRPKTIAGTAFDGAALVLSGLSGPFVILLAPVALLRARRRDASTYLVLSLALLQVLTILRASGDRSREVLGAGIGAFLRIVGGNVLVCVLVGKRGFAALTRIGVFEPPWLLPCLGLVALLLLPACATGAPRELRLLILFSSLVLAAALARPQASLIEPQWNALARPSAGNRYFTPILIAAVTSILWASARSAHPAARNTARIFLVALVLLAIPLDWRDPAYPDYRWREQVARFRAAPGGTRVRFDLPPAGWSLGLVKPWDTPPPRKPRPAPPSHD